MSYSVAAFFTDHWSQPLEPLGVMAAGVYMAIVMVVCATLLIRNNRDERELRAYRAREMAERRQRYVSEKGRKTEQKLGRGHLPMVQKVAWHDL